MRLRLRRGAARSLVEVVEREIPLDEDMIPLDEALWRIQRREVEILAFECHDTNPATNGLHDDITSSSRKRLRRIRGREFRYCREKCGRIG